MKIEIVNWASNVTIALAIIMILIIWGGFLYYGFRQKNYKSVLRSITVLGLFSVWFIIVTIQEWLSSNTSTFEIYSLTSNVGYLIFPLTLIALWRVVFLHVGDYLYYLFTIRQYRLIILGAAFTYGVFYLFASGMLSFADPETPTLNEEGYMVTTQTYGPLSTWPSIEFWWPTFHLFGIISIAGVFMLFSLIGLIGVGIGLVVYQWRLKKKWDLKTMGSTLGSSVAVTATCFVSCALPAVYPLLIALFGSATAEPLARLLANKSGLLVNTVQMAVLSVMVTSVIFAAYRLRRLDKRTRIISDSSM